MPDTQVRFGIKKNGDAAIVDVSVSVEDGRHRELEKEVLEAIEKGVRNVVLDLAGCGYIDSHGLGVLVSLDKKLKEKGGTLKHTHLNADLRTLMELTGLDEVLTIE